MSGTKITTAQVYPKINFSGDKSIIFTPADKEDDIATWEKIIKYYGSDLTNTDLSSNILELKEKKRASNATANTFATYYTLSVKYPVTTESGVVNKTVQPSFVAKNLVSSNGRKRPQHAASLKEYDDYNFLITENNNMTQYGKQFFYVMRHISLTFYHFISESLSKPPSIPCNTHKKETKQYGLHLIRLRFSCKLQCLRLIAEHLTPITNSHLVNLMKLMVRKFCDLNQLLTIKIRI